jgi:hypothetical protein
MASNCTSISPEYFRGDPVHANKAVHLALTTDRFEEVLRLLDASRVHYGDWTGSLRKVETRSDGVSQVFLQDPDGYWIEFNNAVQK